MFFKLLKEILLINKLSKKLGIKSDPKEGDLIDRICNYDEVTKVVELSEREMSRQIELMGLRSKSDYLKTKKALEKELVSLQ